MLSRMFRSGRVGIAVAVVVVLMTAIPAAAAHFITSGQIKDGTIRNRDIKRSTISLNRLTPGVQKLITRKSANSQNSAQSLNGAQGTQGAQGAQGAQGTRGNDGAAGAAGLDSDQPRVVTADSLQGFTLAPKGDNGDTTDNGVTEFSAPPVASNLGSKALHMTTTAGKSVVVYALNQGADPGSTQRYALGELTHASYASLVNSAGAPATDDVTLQFEVTGSTSTNFASRYTTVVFEPYQQPGAPTTIGAWHRHAVDRGLVWSSQAASSSHPTDCTQNVPCPFQTFVNENPQAVVQTVKFRIGTKNGGDQYNQDSYVDDFSYGFGPVVRYDLGG